MNVVKLFPLGFLLLLSSLVAEGNNQPHIVIFVADDLGWNDVGFHGATDLKTPYLDSFAYNGTILSNYYVCPICTPSRSALLTGHHPIHTGLQHDVILAGRPYGLPLNLTIFPQLLKDLGYATHAVGKWHLGYHHKEYTPTYRGFDTFYGYYNGACDYNDHTVFRTNYWGLDFWDSKNITLNPVYDQLGGYSTELYTERATSIINSHQTEKPLFLYVAYQAVHSGSAYSPLVAPDKYINRFPYIKDLNRRTFAGMMSALDDSFGKVTAALSDRGMLENTVVVFTTDNGGPPAGFDMNAASNWPLRGTKANLWEGGVRGSAFIWSTKGKKGIYPGLIHISDWFPTLYEAAGGDSGKLAPMYGMNLWSNIYFGLPSYRESVLHNIDPVDNYASILYGNYKLILGQSSLYSDWDGWYSPPENGTKHGGLIICKQPPPSPEATGCNRDSELCLFDIVKDPCEYNNLAEQEPEVVQFLLIELAYWNYTAVKPLNVPLDPKSDPELHNDLWTTWQDPPSDITITE